MGPIRISPPALCRMDTGALSAWDHVDRAQTECLIFAILASRPLPEQGFRTCLGIVCLFRDIDRNRAEAVSAPALSRSVA